MKKRILLIVLILSLLLAGCSQLGSKDKIYFESYLGKYLSENYIDEHFEITKVEYFEEYDRNCFTYNLVYGDIVANSGAITCFNGRKVNLYHGPKEEFELKVSLEEAKEILEKNDCEIDFFKGKAPEYENLRPMLYAKNNQFFWAGKGKDSFTKDCYVGAETGKFTTKGWEQPFPDRLK